MLDLQTFTRLMGVVGEVQEAITTDNQLFDSLIEDYDGVPRNLARIEELLVDAIQASMGNTTWVEWYVYDAMMGTAPLSTVVDGEEIVVDDLDKLHEIILKECDATTY